MCGRMKYVPREGGAPLVASLTGHGFSREVEALLWVPGGEPTPIQALWQGHARVENLNTVWRGWRKALIPAHSFFEGGREIQLPPDSFIAAIVRQGIRGRWFLAVVTRDPLTTGEAKLVAHKERRRLPLVVRRLPQGGWERVRVC